MSRLGVLLAAVTLATACGPDRSGEIADLVLVNARIHTADPSRPRAEALAIREGRFVAVGTAAEVESLAGSQTRRLDAGGATVLPGLVDSHVHMSSGFSLVRGVNLYGIADREEWFRLIGQRAAALPPGTWIVGGRWDHTLEPGAPWPTRQQLDAVAPDHPVALSDVDGHTTWVNTLALEIGGVDGSTPDPEGGRILRDAAGQPTGILLETAGGLVRRHVPDMTDEERSAVLRETIAYANGLGITGVHDMSGGAVLEEYVRLAESGDLTLRVWYGATGAGPEGMQDLVDLRDRVAARVAGAEARQGPLVQVGYVKLVADGVLSSRTAALLEPYADDPTVTGLPRQSDAELTARVEAANRAGFPVAIHAIGDRAVRMSLDAFETAARTVGSLPLPNRVEHIEVVDPADVDRFAALGVLASMNPHHCITGIDVYNTDRLGSERVAWSFPWGGLRDAGATLVFGSDWATAPLDPLHQLYAAVLREKPAGGPEGGWHPRHRMTLDQAIAAYSRAGAGASGWDDVVGAIRPGQWADFVVLDGALPDPLDRSILERRVRSTWMAGRPVFERSGS